MGRASSITGRARQICELSGGEDRIADVCHQWGDNFIVNFGKEKLKGRFVGPRELDNWHVDGDVSFTTWTRRIKAS
jgi:hypothetical protein